MLLSRLQQVLHGNDWRVAVWRSQWEANYNECMWSAPMQSTTHVGESFGDA